MANIVGGDTVVMPSAFSSLKHKIEQNDYN